jgi:hypothetical protein
MTRDNTAKPFLLKALSQNDRHLLCHKGTNTYYAIAQVPYSKFQLNVSTARGRCGPVRLNCGFKKCMNPQKNTFVSLKPVYDVRRAGTGHILYCRICSVPTCTEFQRMAKQITNQLQLVPVPYVRSRTTRSL